MIIANKRLTFHVLRLTMRRPTVIWVIAKKEFLQKILDFRVIISFVIAILLTLVVAFVVGQDYQTRNAETTNMERH